MHCSLSSLLKILKAPTIWVIKRPVNTRANRIFKRTKSCKLNMGLAGSRSIKAIQAYNTKIWKILRIHEKCFISLPLAFRCLNDFYFRSGNLRHILSCLDNLLLFLLFYYVPQQIKFYFSKNILIFSLSKSNKISLPSEN